LKGANVERRIGISLLVAFASFVLSFIIFNVAYIKWAVWRYPQHNSMAGFAAFIYGIPIGAACALLGAAIAFPLTKRKSN
jgi:hypothetical protein